MNPPNAVFNYLGVTVDMPPNIHSTIFWSVELWV